MTRAMTKDVPASLTSAGTKNMTTSRFHYAATGFPIGYWHYQRWARPLIQQLYMAHARLR